jgi:DNA mismatch repair protein MLH1
MHPTKREVGFLNEDEVIEKICATVQKQLGEGDSTRRFTVQTLLPGAKPIETSVAEDKGLSSNHLTVGNKAYSNYLVRTDPKTRKITTMFAAQGNVPQTTSGDEEYEVVDKDRAPVKLASIRELRDEVMDLAHNGNQLRSG